MWITEIECVPEQKGGSKVSQYLVWPPAALSTSVHLLMDCTRFFSFCCEMLPHSSTKAPVSSWTFLWGIALALPIRSNRSQMCSIRLRYGFFAGHGRTLTILSCRKSRTERVVWLVALSCWRVMSGWAGRVPHEGGGCLPFNQNQIKSNQMYLYSPSYISWYLKVLYRNPA